MRVVVHTLGESDLGLDYERRVRGEMAARVGHLRAALDADDADAVRRLLCAPVDGRVFVPLQVMLHGFAEGDRLLLLATDGGDERDTAPLAALVPRALALVPDLYGPVLPAVPADAVEVVDLASPSFAEAHEKISEWFERSVRLEDVTEISVGVGTGATNIVFGCLVAVLSAGPAVVVRPLPEARLGGAAEIPIDQDPVPWLARRRMFGALAAHLADSHPQSSRLLELLDARQRLDTDRFTKLARLLGFDPDGPLSLACTEALENAFFDRLVRREVQATMIGRAWMARRYEDLRGPGEPAPANLGKLIKKVERLPGPQQTAKAARSFLLDSRVIYGQATDGRHGLRAPDADYLRGTAVLAAEADGRDPRRVEPRLCTLGGSADGLDLFAWSSARSGRVLVAYGVGHHEVSEDGTRPFAKALCGDAWLAEVARLVDGQGPDDGGRATMTPIVRLVGSGGGERATIGEARRSAEYIGARIGERSGLCRGGVTWPAAIEVPLDIKRAREDIRKAFLAEGMRDVEAIVVFTGPAKQEMNLGLLLAGVDAAARIGCPVFVGSLPDLLNGETGVQVSAAQVPALPGYPGLLAAVAREHLTDLEVSAAAEVLRAGGRRLAPLATSAAALRDAFTEVDAALPVAQRHADVARRIELIRDMLAAKGDPDGRGRADFDDWHALHLAMTVADAVLGNWPRSTYGALAYRVRNWAPTTHGYERARSNGFPALRSFGDVLEEQQESLVGVRVDTCDELLAKVQGELDPSGDREARRSLVTRYRALLDALTEHFAPPGSAA